MTSVEQPARPDLAESVFEVSCVKGDLAKAHRRV